MNRADELAAARRLQRRRLLDEWERRDNRAIAIIAIGAFLLGAAAFGALVILDVVR